MSSSDDESVESYHSGSDAADVIIERCDFNNANELNQKKLDRLKRLRDKVNWGIEEERHEFLWQLSSLIGDWEDKLPNLRDIFREEEIDWLLTDSIDYIGDNNPGEIFFNFVARSGYKDEPDYDKHGKPLLYRTTPVHHAARQGCSYIAGKLFELYTRFDVNYIDESGLTHFHVACKYGFDDVVAKFLEFGQNPNCVWKRTGDSPLHVALRYGHRKTAELLLRNDADPNLTNAEGFTALHVICKYCYDGHDFADILFKISEEKDQLVQVNALDKKRRTPLQWAVARFLPNTVDLLLGHGADLSSFVFPTASHFDDDFKRYKSIINELKLKVTFGALSVIDRLDKKGYQLDRSDALTVMTFFADHGLFQKSKNLDPCWYKDEEFTRETKKITICQNLSLYDLIHLPPEEAAKQLTKFYSGKLCNLPKRYAEACAMHLCEVMSRKFCRRWALDSFMQLTSYRLPILCCEMIIEPLINEDLWRICLATTNQSSYIQPIVL
uniref:Uncharacterized protein n=1 Tax=Trichogramma kaykai TaxID=54128 RepID=A0ABD2XFM9_9HYME